MTSTMKKSLLGTGLLLAAGLGALVWLNWNAREETVETEAEEPARKLIGEKKPAKAAARKTASARPKEQADKSAWARKDVPPVKTLEEMSAEAEAAKARRPKVVFSNVAEQCLMMVTTQFAGEEIPPLPFLDEESIEKTAEEALRRTHGVSEGDDERRLENKLSVERLKEEFRELKDKGVSFKQFLEAARELHNDNALYMREAAETDAKLYADTSLSDADYLKLRAEINAGLKERGLPELEPIEEQANGEENVE